MKLRPPAHPDDDVRGYFRAVVLPTREAWVAVAADRVVGLMAIHDAWVEQLYVDPPSVGRGVGTALIALAKQQRPGGLGLWTFQANARARRFYEARGFVAVEFTDGRASMERQPDVRYAWTPPLP